MAFISPPDHITEIEASGREPEMHTSLDLDPQTFEDELSGNEKRTDTEIDPAVDEEGIRRKSDPTATDNNDDNSVVDWEPGDAEKPVNWTTKKKWSNIAVISTITFLTPLASSMIAPATPLIMEDFQSTNSTVASFIVSIYVLGYALGPLFLAPLSEVYGRLPIYHGCNFMFVIWTVACALAPGISSMLVFRLLAGIAGSCPLTIGGGSIGDLMVQEQRGAAMAVFAMGPLMGPVIGPIAGGYLGQAAGWKWVFWTIAAAGGAVLIISALILRETYEPVLLARRANRLQRITGNTALRSKLDEGLQMRQYFLRAIVRPTGMLLFSPIVLTLSIYMAMVYGYQYLLFTTFTQIFEDNYHFSHGSVGLSFLGVGVGAMIGLFAFGALSDRVVQRLSIASQGEMKPEYRLPPLIPGSLLIPIGLIWYGWSADKHIHWIMPIIGTAFVGMGLLATFMPIQTYLVDAFQMHAASALAANTVLRSLLGAFLPLAGPQMYDSLGLGWGNTLLAFLALAMSPVSWIFFKYGERLRKRYDVQF
ncbi:hypothetical protein H2204_004907 [Knufia peltigerae]|uniref:Major facilitator superfamily (MFS) profile domain-containing protein n=1 Tax=Knufia peltigerae TaxID=1002370 RepID=A0AA38Y6Z3_9EURO|nr:hypothetical protein H2204_004907 [Knufia peltigerae]